MIFPGYDVSDILSIHIYLQGAFVSIIVRRQCIYVLLYGVSLYLCINSVQLCHLCHLYFVAYTVYLTEIFSEWMKKEES